MAGSTDAIMDRMNGKIRVRSLTNILWEPGELLYVLVIAVVAGILRFYRIDEKSIWLDEAFSLWIARHSLWEGWRWLIEVDQHPPFYYSLLHSWIWMFGPLEGAVRTLSALASTLTVPVFYAGCRRLLDRQTASIAVGILAVSPFHVQFGQETRMYALLTLEVAFVIYFLARLVTSRVPKGRDWVGLAVAQALVMLTHNAAAVYLPVALNAAAGLIFLLFPSGIGRDAGDGQEKEEQAEADSVDGSQKDSSKIPAPTQREVSSTAARKAETDAFWLNWVRFQGLAVLLWLPWAVPFIIQVIDVGSGFWLPRRGPTWCWTRFVTFTSHSFPRIYPGARWGCGAIPFWLASGWLACLRWEAPYQESCDGSDGAARETDRRATRVLLRTRTATGLRF